MKTREKGSGFLAEGGLFRIGYQEFCFWRWEARRRKGRGRVVLFKGLRV